MAIDPLINGAAQPVQPIPRRDVTAAQRAFFQAALNQAGAVADPAPVTAAAAAEPSQPAARAPAEPVPLQGYRPGKLLDIRV